MEHDPVDGRGGGHGVGEDAFPLAEEQVGRDAQRRSLAALGDRGEEDPGLLVALGQAAQVVQREEVEVVQLAGPAYPGTAPREQRSLMACTSWRSSVSRCISAETLATPCATVLWLRPPSRRPACVSARPISWTSRYIATCLGTDMARLRLTLTRSSTLRPKCPATSDRMRCESIISLANVASNSPTGISPYLFTIRFLQPGSNASWTHYMAAPRPYQARRLRLDGYGCTAVCAWRLGPGNAGRCCPPECSAQSAPPGSSGAEDHFSNRPHSRCAGEGRAVRVAGNL